MAEHLYVDTVVIGGGTAGAAVAARLVQGTSQTVMLIESGPDYGASTGRPGHLLERARVIGGCSSHNGCAAIWGSQADYDGWVALGNAGWSADALLPFFKL